MRVHVRTWLLITLLTIAFLPIDAAAAAANVSPGFDPASHSRAAEAAPPNPWGYNFDAGPLIYTPPANFCSYFSCIPSFTSGVGYVVQCGDRMFSLSGGRTGVCSNHGNFFRNLYGPVVCDGTGTLTQTVYLPNITRTLGGPLGWDTPFYVQNAGSAATALETSFYYFDTGALAACHRTASLAAGASILEDPNAAGDLTDNKQYSVVVRSYGSPIFAAVNQSQSIGGKVQALSYSGFSVGATKIYVPNVTRRFFGYDIPLIIQNLGTSTASITANFKSFDGTQDVNIPLTIGVGLSGVIDPDFTPGLVDGTQYAVTVTGSQPVAVVANAHDEAIGPVAFSHNGLASGATTVYGPWATKGATFSNVVVQNLGTAAATATLSFKPTSGAAAQVFTSPSIPAGGAQAFDVRFTNGIALAGAAQCGSVASPTCLGDGDYGLTVTSAQPVAAVVLPNSNTLAGAYVGLTSPTTKTLLPVAQRNAAGWSASIWLQSVTASSATLTFTPVGGGAAIPVTTPLTAGATKKIDLASTAGLTDGQAYSVVITGNGPIAAVVQELNLAPGDGLMVYEGFAQ